MIYLKEFLSLRWSLASLVARFAGRSLRWSAVGILKVLGVLLEVLLVVVAVLLMVLEVDLRLQFLTPTISELTPAQ